MSDLDLTGATLNLRRKLKAVLDSVKASPVWNLVKSTEIQTPAGAERRRGARKPLTRELILHAAFRLVDSEGLEALNMRRLGAELGVVGMTLYRYFPQKEALLHDLVQAMFEEISAGEARGRDWREHLRAVM